MTGNKSNRENETNTPAQDVEYTWLQPGSVLLGVSMVPIEGDVVHGRQAYRTEISADKAEAIIRQTKSCIEDGIERFKATIDTLDLTIEQRDRVKAGIDQAYANAKADLAGRAA